VNIFGTRGSGSFANTTAFVVRKSTLLATNNAPTNIVVTAFRSLVPNGNSGGLYTPQGVDNYDPAATEGYVIGVTSTHNFWSSASYRCAGSATPAARRQFPGNIDITIR